MTAALFPAWAAALSLGAPQLDSGLGQILELAIPIRADAGEDFDSKCVRLVNPLDDQLPTLTVARIRVEQDGMLLLVRIQSLAPIDEPAIRLILEAGCTQRVQREYVLLIDPPALGRGSAGVDRRPGVAPAEIAMAASALAIGEPRIQASQGRRLLLNAPIVGDDAARVKANCVRLLDDGGQPAVYESARVRLVNAGSARPSIEIVGTKPLRDLMLRLVVEVGCESAVRREFNVLVDSAPVPTTSGALVEAAPGPAPRAGATAPRAGGVPSSSATAPGRAAAPALSAPAGSAIGGAPAAKGTPAAAVPDRLVLATPDNVQPAPAPRAAGVPDASEELVKRLDQLSGEVKRLRGELDAATRQNAALADKLAEGRSLNYLWWIVGVMALALAGWLAIAWRRRGEDSEDAVTEGPLTRIVGNPTVEVPAAAQPPAGTAMGSVLVGSHLLEMRPDLHVTEMADEESIRELYSDVIRSTTSPGDRATNVDIPLESIAADTAIDGLVDVEHAAPKGQTRQGSSRPMSDVGGAGAPPVAKPLNADLIEPWEQGEPPPSQMPTTVLKPLELDLDLSDFAQGDRKAAGN